MSQNQAVTACVLPAVDMGLLAAACDRARAWPLPGQGQTARRLSRLRSQAEGDLDLGPDLTRRKRRAVRCFATQLTGTDPILPAAVIERLTRPYEVLLGP